MSGATGELASLSRVLLSVNTMEGDAGFKNSSNKWSIEYFHHVAKWWGRGAKVRRHGPCPQGDSLSSRHHMVVSGDDG